MVWFDPADVERFMADLPSALEPSPWQLSETALAAKHERIANYWAAMKEKHRRAALYPWQSVEPDPPPPPE